MAEETLCLSFPWDASRDAEFLRKREWLVTNGLGGYASSTLSGEGTRRYHGLFIPNLPAPRGRTVLFPRIEDCLEDAGETIPLDPRVLEEFKLDWGVPHWLFAFKGRRIRKRIVMPYGQNTVYIEYRLMDGPAARLRLRPYASFRGHDEPLGHPLEWRFSTRFVGSQFEIEAYPGAIPLKLTLAGGHGSFVADPVREDVSYPVELERGLDATESLRSPGYFSVALEPGASIALVASVEPWELLAIEPEALFNAEKQRLEKLLSRATPKAQSGWMRHLVLAADQFIVTPGSRVEENALLKASGDKACTVIAGYHWFTDWGRDTMISLEGLTLCTGRFQEARAILRTFSHYVHNGLLPNHFPEGQRTAVYHTVDATFWYFHAIDRYVQATGDKDTLDFLYPVLVSILDHHQRGTDFGIGMDSDGLIREGSPDWPLTWMDAKADDWIVTPRRGKPVEIQALWYNALSLMAGWTRQRAGDASAYETLATKAYASFNQKYWHEKGGYLYDLVEGENGNDAAIRPNQLFSVSLPHPILDPQRWKSVVDVVGHELWTPVGLRSLTPSHPDYRARYEGNRRARDGAYHQGLVWGWLIGPYVDAWCKVHGSREGVAHLLKGFEEHLRDAGIGTISEIFDGASPHIPRGCIAQAWSVAEALRVLVGPLKSKTS